MINEVMTVKEAAEIWGVNYKYLGNLLNNSNAYRKMDILMLGIDYKKSGGTWLITKSAMEKLYGEREING